MDIYLDIETLPAQRTEDIYYLKLEHEKEKAKVQAPANYKDPLKIAEAIAIKHAELDLYYDDKYRKTALDGAVGRIFCIGYAIDNYPPSIIQIEDEAEMLEAFYRVMSEFYSPIDRPCFIGHNIVSFDLKFILQRSIVHGVKPPSMMPFKAKPWDDSIYDTMTEWAGVNKLISMDKLCQIFNLKGKGEITGANIWDNYLAGNFDLISDYCKDDVIRTRQIHRRLTFQG